MRDAAGQLAHAFHFLRLQQLFLGFFACRHFGQKLARAFRHPLLQRTGQRGQGRSLRASSANSRSRSRSEFLREVMSNDTPTSDTSCRTDS